MPLNTEEQPAGGRIPAVAFSYWFVDAPRVLATVQTVVLNIVDQLNEKDTNETVHQMEENGFGTEAKINRCKDATVQNTETNYPILVD